MSEVLLTTSDTRGVKTLTLNRPERRNALDAALVEALHERCAALQKDNDTRVVVITGAGDTFCSGADLHWMHAMSHAAPETNLATARRLGTLMQALRSLPQTTVARIQGPAFAGGLGLVAACDIAVAASHAEMSFSEVRIGLAPAVITPNIVAAIGMRTARKLFLTAERFSALEAKRYGLVHDVVNPEALDETIKRTVTMLLAAAPQALRACKRALLDFERDTDPDNSAKLLAKLRASDEGREGLAAFLEKRTPNWHKP